MTDHTPDALASALPAGIIYTGLHNERLLRRDVAAFQAERLAEAGYVLLHPEFVDEATVERLAERLLAQGGHAEYASEKIREIARDDVRIILAALGAPEQTGPDGGQGEAVRADG